MTRCCVTGWSGGSSGGCSASRLFGGSLWRAGRGRGPMSGASAACESRGAQPGVRHGEAQGMEADGSQASPGLRGLARGCAW
jgi:hypothetical protein